MGSGCSPVGFEVEVIFQIPQSSVGVINAWTSVGGLTLEIGHDPVHETFAFRSDVFVVEFRQLPQQLLLSLAEFLGNLDQCLYEEISFGTGMRVRHASSADVEYRSALNACGNLQILSSFECWDFDGCAECRLAEGDGPLEDEILTVSLEEWVGFHVDEAIGISARAAVRARLPFSLKTNAHSIIDTRRDPDFEFDWEGLQANAIAIATWVADGLAAPSTNRAGGLHAEYTCCLNDLTSTLASFACFGL
jgi:hypothetical protein